MPARPPDTNRMKLKTLGWRIGKDWDTDSRILFSLIITECWNSLKSYAVLWPYSKSARDAEHKLGSRARNSFDVWMFVRVCIAIRFKLFVTGLQTVFK
jgi:hypothetical protein